MVYCIEKELNINVQKSKILKFGKGSPKKMNPFKMQGEILEEVKEFKYLGIIFTVGLTFSKHLIEQAEKHLGGQDTYSVNWT